MDKTSLILFRCMTLYMPGSQSTSRTVGGIIVTVSSKWKDIARAGMQLGNEFAAASFR